MECVSPGCPQQMTPDPLTDLSARVAAGDARAIARAISLVEDDGAAGPGADQPDLPADRSRVPGRRHRGARHRQEHARRSARSRRFGALALKVGVIAVDPTSPFSGGAVLGDRVRMNAHAADPGVFIRSMATRGHLGGLARATSDAALVLDAAGIDVVIIETVESARTKWTSSRPLTSRSSLLVPGAGDDLQAIKAGVMEIARHLRREQGRSRRRRSRRPGGGVEPVAQDLQAHRSGSRRSSRPRRRREPGVEGLWEEIGTVPRVGGDAPRRETPAAAAYRACAMCSRSRSCGTSTACFRPVTSIAWSRSQ